MCTTSILGHFILDLAKSLPLLVREQRFSRGDTLPLLIPLTWMGSLVTVCSSKRILRFGFLDAISKAVFPLCRLEITLTLIEVITPQFGKVQIDTITLTEKNICFKFHMGYN